MLRLRIAAAALLLALLASAAMPCFALGPGPEAAMACCKAKAHSSCQTPSMAEQCCRHGESSQQDREIQLNLAASTAIALAPSSSVFDHVLTPFIQEASAILSGVAPSISPPRNCPLLI